MSFRERIRIATGSGRLLSATLGLCVCLHAPAEKPPVPAVRIPLEDLGFPGYAPTLLRVASYSMSTVHMLDSTHLLFTYSMRTLVPRLPGDDENDSDRVVAAGILEIPSGKVLARTQWRLHDHGRYLWRVGDGVFVLRTADELSLFAPLRGLASGTAFQRIALPHQPGLPQVISSSPDGAILTVQVQGGEDTESSGDDDAVATKPKHTTIEFFRIAAPAQADAPIQVRPAGAVGSPGLLRLALDGDGYLWAEDRDRSGWQVSFNEYEGKPQNLAALHSSCPPRLALLSRGEFLAESCQGLNSTPMLSVYGFDGHENWEEPFPEDLQPPTIVTAPAAGRFAISRLIAQKSGTGVYDLAPDDAMSQELRVYQTGSGNLLLRLRCSAPVRTAENFDLSPDGSELAVLGRDAIEIYKLPALTDRDHKDLADVQTMTPPLEHGPVVLARITHPVGGNRKMLKVDDATGTPGPTRSTAVAAADGSAAGPKGPSEDASGSGIAGQPALKHASEQRSAVASAASDPGGFNGRPADAPAQALGQNAGARAVGDSVVAPRKPPTLLNPGESPEFKAPSSVPQ